MEQEAECCIEATGFTDLPLSPLLAYTLIYMTFDPFIRHLQYPIGYPRFIYFSGVYVG